ncbi:MAG: N-acetyltransferase family protein [Immundisolibacter sp.]|uniref:GNAT family N-acetyltransferase n=1 Tax=Immundisolibacter sp. TaxID=1934948 RepID=UPI003EE22FFE
MNKAPDLRIESLQGKVAMREFWSLPQRLYRDDPHAVASLLAERHELLSPRNPLFEHAFYQGWLAYRGNELVGRITAQVDRLYEQTHGERVGYFGLLEAQDDPAVFAALLARAEGWLREQGMTEVRGPFNLSINEECGLLVDGFDAPPMVMMGHALPYYAARLVEQGYVKAQDLLAYIVDTDFQFPLAAQRVLERERGKVQLRPIDYKNMGRDIEILRDIFNDAWLGNWGFVPFTEAEFKALGPMLRWLVDPAFVQIAEVDGEPVAMLAMLPNINEAIAGLNGRLLPFGWAKLLWRLKVRHPKTVRVALMGVRQRHQRTRLGAALAMLVIDAARKAAVRRGATQAEMSWILDDNRGMRSIIESLGSRCYKRYRLYTKPL